MVKATIDIEAPTDGYVEKIWVTNGESFALGATLATFKNSDSSS
jgi:biotin carboxyl carrier protein